PAPPAHPGGCRPMPFCSFARRRLAPAGLLALLLAWPHLTPGQDPQPVAVAVVLKGHTEPVYGIAFTPDGKAVVTGSFDKTLKAWDAATGREIKTFGGAQGHQNLVVALALSPDGTLIASGSTDNTAKV